ncbi:MAG TPA: hypothetical protein VIH91_06755 [Terriglobales bacterium]
MSRRNDGPATASRDSPDDLSRVDCLVGALDVGAARSLTPGIAGVLHESKPAGRDFWCAPPAAMRPRSTPRTLLGAKKQCRQQEAKPTRTLRELACGYVNLRGASGTREPNDGYQGRHMPTPDTGT